MNRKGIILILLLLATAMFSSCQQQNKNPNIILFLADDMGYGDPQSYMPSSKIPTPNIDHLAAGGVRFADAHSPSSVCSPTRYAILTGRYAWRTHLKLGVLGPYNQPLIEQDQLTLPAMLQELGYSTACIGKWHLGMQWATKDSSELPMEWERDFDQSVIDHSKPITAGPLTAGFDYYFGTDVPNFPPYLFIENDRTIGMPTIPKPDTIYGNPGLMLPGWKLEDILPTLTQKAVKYIDDNAKSTDPFFLYFASTAPHTPIVPAKEFYGKSQAGPYGDLVHQVDYSLGELMKALDRNGITDNTMVIFTSDNGSPARAGDPHLHGKDFQVTGSVITKYGHNPNAPWRGMKADIWEGGHRVPFIMRWPAWLAEGKNTSQPICSIDIMASIASITNYMLPENAAPDSRDISYLFESAGDEIDTDKAIIHHSGNGKFAIRQGNWKLIPQLGSGGWTPPRFIESSDSIVQGQLYNLHDDPKESNNLWIEHSEKADLMLGLLESYKSE